MICRPCNPEDKAAVLAVLRESYDGWFGMRSEAVWDWKFARNPHGPARIWVGDEGGRIVGCYILTPVMLRVGGETIRGAQSVDAAVSTDFRGRGVFTDLARAALRDAADAGIKLVFAFPGEGAFGGQVRVGFKPQLAVPTAYRPLIWPPRRRRFSELTLGDVDMFDARFDVFCEHGDDREISLRRDAAYLHWRFDEHPTQRYEAITCERSGEICGYCVLRVRVTRNLSPGYIVDLQVLPGSGSAAQFLVYHGLRRLRSLGSRVVVSWERPTGQAQEALRACGFSPGYASVRRQLRRTRYADQLIAFHSEDVIVAEQEVGAPAANHRSWSLVPGDADYM
ncbi:MAG TPA: GNAT family N-acetyltransferase [Solirubrobacteraceae bacterium]|jgi:predicted N-acetyltransferase YhbS